MSGHSALRYRLTSFHSILPTYQQLAFEFGPHQDLFQRLPEAWRTLDRVNAMPVAVIERIHPPAPPELVAYGASVFLSQAMAERLKDEPFVAAQVMREALSGGSGVLSLKEIQAGHANGELNLLILHAQYLGSSMGFIGKQDVYEALARSFFEYHRGYRIHQCFVEVFTSEAAKHHQGSGFFVRANHGSIEPSFEMPWLLGVSREEAMQHAGSRVSALFVDYPIRLKFRKVHREVLSLALVGATDEEIAEELSLTLSAVRRRWETIYEIVDRQAPDIVWEGRLQTSAVRGPERRRHLLNYLREHPEELRPLFD